MFLKQNRTIYYYVVHVIQTDTAVRGNCCRNNKCRGVCEGSPSAIIIGGNLIRSPCVITTDSFYNAALISDRPATAARV